MKQKTTKFSSGHYIELMDRVYVIQCNIEDHLFKHCAMTKKQQKRLDKAQELLNGVYQWAGKKEFECGG